ncbi:DUF3575 domain-containing protein [Hymenobacter ginkgonis]|uniref:DUF3575 domain-containing protein n=1 Tax=Hymenobacter ginkgonis TaxID=2682976 RepID=UPI0018DB905E|nr:DUF3575 domain-containing protein [Hymenobacter ginkgonis]
MNFSPLATLDPNTSTLLFGVEYRLSQRIGVAAEYGARFRPLQLTGFGLTKNKNDYHYYKIKAEVRYYLPPIDKHPHQEIYMALQPFFVPQTYTRYNDNYVVNDIHIGYDRADVKKTVTGLDFKLGFIWHYGPSWQLEVGGGLGIRHVSVAYQTDREFLEQRANQFQVNMFNQSEKPGSGLDFDVATVCKVGYRFGLPRR